jgi:hypothetical protein
MWTKKRESAAIRATLLLLFGWSLVACTVSETTGPAVADELALSSPQPVPRSVPHPVTPIMPDADTHEGEFAIHLVGQSITAVELMSSSINEVALEAAPILSQSDIVAYDWETHQMELTSGGYEKLAELESRVMHEGGLGFVACVGEERIYSGAFWSSLSSAVFPGTVIDVNRAVLAQPLTIQLGYPTQKWFEGIDARSDSRIQQSLQESGRLQ